MTIEFVSNGNPARIPPIGSVMKMSEHLYFRVDKYGDTNSGELFTLQLIGTLFVPDIGTAIFPPFEFSKSIPAEMNS